MVGGHAPFGGLHRVVARPPNPQLLNRPHQRRVDLTDTQIGLLIGPSFAIFYITLGIPIGWLADRRNRRTMIAAGVALWSLMTALSGFARSFTHLFLARIGVGVGEAALIPCALSLIADYFPPEKRARAASLYMSGISLGTAFGSMLGCRIVSRVTHTPEVTLPVIVVVAGWQAAFIVVGTGTDFGRPGDDDRRTAPA